MKVAIVGSRSIVIPNLEDYLPEGTTEIVSGGARGVDTSAAEYAKAHGLLLTEFRPDYARYNRGAPLVRNRTIVEYADMVIAFWDGKSRGTIHTVKYCKELGKPLRLLRLREETEWDVVSDE